MNLCPFCALGRERTSVETEHAVAFVDAFPVSGGHTLVVPRQRLPAIVHLAAWAERNERFDGQIRESLEERGFIAELAASNQVAHWAYAQAEAANAMTWLRGDEMVALDPGWHGLFKARAGS